MLDNLAELSRLGLSESRHQRHVPLAAAAAESARQVREAARSRRVDIRISDMPAIEVNAAAVELALTNLLSNAIKYCDPHAAERWVHVSARYRPNESADGGDDIVVYVADNGLGVPASQRQHLFERFFRAHTESAGDVDGTGLGLSIVRETVESVGGRAWAEFPTTGSVFAFSLPCRRSDDRSAVADIARKD